MLDFLQPEITNDTEQKRIDFELLFLLLFCCVVTVALKNIQEYLVILPI